MTRRLLLAIVLCTGVVMLRGDDAAPRTPEQIRNEMTAIRRGTNWKDAAAAKEAKARIAALADELLNLTKRKAPGATGTSAPGNADLADPAEGGVDPARVLSQLRAQAAEAIGGGKGSDVLLAKKVREQIVEEYVEDAKPQIKNADFFAETRTLILDLSSPATPAVIEQMEKFRGIETLIILSGQRGVAVDLPDILGKAAGYPLRELYIIHFGSVLRDLPAGISRFSQLQLLAVFDNGIEALPPEFATLQHLETLYLDGNPIRTVLPIVRSLPNLRQLGIGKTEISDAEQLEIRRLLPDCTLRLE